ncbi:DUF2845 domain-containing protein [Frateuria sp. STR12]|uniref:DUF2845 domain-containing protein n=1 Tax=Frateuria hangzhouensis TaxID=2995589 RepID=UPI0022610430|nr:DUF2845 domain-containing protein [Frateuria sp. STR12]MCX7512779.1 DUF2845 domain-containing protein [Frateuria sp. STR12]
MRKLLLGVVCALAWLTASPWAHAGNTYRVGSRVLTVGDSAVFTRSLLGDPQYKEPIEDRFGAFRGERWQYQVDGRMVTVTIMAGKVGDIQIEQR